MNEQRHNILVVDDDRAVRTMLAGFLKQAGFGVCTADDGVEALDSMKHRHVDAVVTDYQMPRMNGLEFLTFSTLLWPKTPVLVVSGDQSDEIADLVMRRGAFMWLHKPYELSLLLQILRLAVEQSVGEQVNVTTSDIALKS